MTKTDARLALVERQRRYEWTTARAAATTAAAQLVAGKTHDLLNFLQVAQLTAQELLRRSAGADPDELLADLLAAAATAQHGLAAMMAVARPHVVVRPGAPIGPVIDEAVAAVRAAGIEVALTVTAPAALTTRCAADALAHLVIGLGLAAAGPIDLVVRDRLIAGARWLELVCGGAGDPDALDPPFDLRAVEAIAVEHGGELSHSARRGGGVERIVALPVVG
jgi:hypothetical protein